MMNLQRKGRDLCLDGRKINRKVMKKVKKNKELDDKN